MSLIGELKRRNVIRAAIGYVGVSWLLVQVIDTLFPIFGVSDAVARGMVVALAIGFIPALVVAWKFELTPEGLRRDADADRSAPGMRDVGRRLDHAITIVLVLAVGYFAVDKFLLDPARDQEVLAEAVEQARIQALVDSYGDRSIAVLPFVNMSNDEEQEYFADGLTEELLNLLAQVDELRVISRSSVFRYKGMDIHIPTVASELDVAFVLEGSVRRDGDMIRVTAQLIDASDSHLWSDAYDREFREIFAIQDEVAAKVVDSLEVYLPGASAPTTRERDPEVFALHLKASYLLNLNTSEATAEAQELLQEALRRDPQDTDVLHEMARVLLRELGPNPESRQRVEAMLEHIENINPGDPGIAGWHAFFAIEFDSDVKAAAPLVEEALRNASRDKDLYRSMLPSVVLLGAVDEAIAIGEHIVAMDPLCAQCQYQLARAYRLNGQLDEAEAAARAALILIPDETGMPIQRDLGRTLFFKGEFEEALEWFTRADDSVGIAATLHELGRMDDFEEALQLAKDEVADFWPGGIAWIYAAIGDNDAALDWLVKPTIMSPMSVARELEYYVYRNLREDPRFIAIQEELGVSPAQLEALDFRPMLPPGVTVP